jgi:hypothetical protein
VTIAAPAPGAPGRAFSRAAAWPPSASYGASRRAESQPCDSSCKVAAMAARASAIIEIVTTLRKYGSSAGRSLAYRKPLVDRLAPVVDAGRARLLTVGQHLQEVGQLGVAVRLTKPCHGIAAAPAARLAYDRERQPVDVR